MCQGYKIAAKELQNNRRIIAFMFLFMIIVLLAAVFTGCTPAPPKDMAYVPGSEFYMGSNEVDTEAKSLQYGNKVPWFANERPMRKVKQKAFFIDKYEVSNKRYKQFYGYDCYDKSKYDYVIDTSDLSVKEVVDDVLEIIGK